MNTTQLNKKYSEREIELFLEAARGTILTYEEFIERFNQLNDEYLREANEIGCNETSIDKLFLENARSAQARGESLKDYAYSYCTIVNDLSINVKFKYDDDDE